MGRNSDLSGIAAMMAATAVFVVGDSFMKLATEDLPPFEVLFLRGLAASLACAVFVVWRGEQRAISGALNRHALLRAAGETLSVLCYIVALARMPLADVLAILQTAPLILTLAAAVLLREKIGAARVFLVLLGFVGALMVSQPGAAGFSTAALFAFASAVLIAARDIVGGSVPTRIPVTVVTLATTIMVMLASGALSSAIETWTPPTGRHLAYLCAAGLMVTSGHAGLLLAYRLGRTATIAPFLYSFALWGVLAGWIVWRTLPNPIALAGIALIVLSGVALVLFDQRRSRRALPLTEAL